MINYKTVIPLFRKSLAEEEEGEEGEHRQFQSGMLLGSKRNNQLNCDILTLFRNGFT